MRKSGAGPGSEGVFAGKFMGQDKLRQNAGMPASPRARRHAGSGAKAIPELGVRFLNLHEVAAPSWSRRLIASTSGHSNSGIGSSDGSRRLFGGLSGGSFQALNEGLQLHVVRPFLNLRALDDEDRAAFERNFLER